MKASNNFECRFVTEEDYNNILLKWWGEWNWTAPPLSALPKGVIISKNGVDLYAGYLYLTGTTMGWFEWIVSNKNASVDLKRGALNELVSTLSIIAKNNGVTTLFSATPLSSFKNSLIKSGFSITDKNCTHLIKNI